MHLDRTDTATYVAETKQMSWNTSRWSKAFFDTYYVDVSL